MALGRAMVLKVCAFFALQVFCLTGKAGALQAFATMGQDCHIRMQDLPSQFHRIVYMHHNASLLASVGVVSIAKGVSGTYKVL